MKRILLRRINYYHFFVSGLHTARSGVRKNQMNRTEPIQPHRREWPRDFRAEHHPQREEEVVPGRTSIHATLLPQRRAEGEVN
jgi:hypothetical protein